MYIYSEAERQRDDDLVREKERAYVLRINYLYHVYILFTFAYS